MNRSFLHAWKLLVLCMGVCLCHGTAFGQDGHYWNRNYGSTSTLLGGAVLGANADLGSIYYNPAALAFRDSIRVSFSSSVHDAEYLKIRNGTADSVNTTSLTFQSYPFTIIPSFKFGEKTYLGLVFLTRFSSDFQMHQLDTGRYDVLSDGNKYPFTGVFDYRNELSERWYGGSLSRRMTANSSLGLGFFVGYRSQTSSNSYNATAVLPPSDSLDLNRYILTSISRFIHYYHYKAILKLGYFHHSQRLSYGIVATLPCIPLFGSGRSSARYFVSTLPDSLSTDQPVNALVFDEQDDLKATNKYPATIGAGMTLHLESWKLYASAEYFFGIEPYDIMVPDQSQDIRPAAWFNINPQDFIGVRTSAKSVLNAGIGFSYSLSGKRNILGSITTDMNSLPMDRHRFGNNVSACSWDLYHLSGGMSFRVWKIDLLFGARYSTGRSKNQPQLVDMRSPSNSNLLMGDIDNNMEQLYRSLSVLLGFNF